MHHHGRLSVPAVASPAITTPIAAAGSLPASVLGAWAAGPVVGVAVSVAQQAAQWLLGRRAERDRLEKLLRDAVLFESESDNSVAEPQFVVGTAKTRGVLGAPIDTGEFSQLYQADSRLRVRPIHTVTLLSAGPLADVKGLWVDGVQAPLVGSAGSRTWETTGLGTRPPLGLWSWLLGDGDGPLYREAQALQARMTALVPSWRPANDSDFVNVPDDTDHVVAALFHDLLDEWNAYVAMRRGVWTDNRQVKRSAGGAAEAAGEPVISARFSFGAGDDVPSAVVQQYALGWTPSRSREDATNGRRRRTVPGWLPTDLCKSTAWVLTRHRFWRQGSELAPYARLPELNWLVQGGGDFDGNPARFARAVYRLPPYARPDTALRGLAAAVARCAEVLPVREMALSDVGATDIPDGQLRWDTYRDVLWPDGNFPSDADQSKVLAEVNLREAGAANARPRFQIDRIVTASEIESGEALARAGEAMGGYFVELPGARIGFRPAQPRSAVVVVTDDDLLDRPTWAMGQPRPNAFETVLPADRERQWKPSTLPVTQAAALVARDGLVVETREAWGLSDNLAARRQDAMLLDRDAADKREGMLLLKHLSPTDPKGAVEPMDVVRLELQEGVVARAEVQMVQVLAGKLRWMVRELGPTTYDDRYFPKALDRDPDGANPGGPDMGFGWNTQFRQTADGRVADLNVVLGEDVEQIEVEASWQERVASKPPVPAEVQHYLAAVPESARGVLHVHTVKDQAATSPLTVVGDDAEAQVFVGDLNRELSITMRTLRGGLVGDVQAVVLVPSSTPGGSPVTFKGVAEEVITSAAGDLVGWRVVVYGVHVADGVLVISFSGGGADGTNWEIPSEDTSDNVHGVAQADGTLRLVIVNTFRLGANQIKLSMAARTGGGTSSDPHVFSAAVAVDLSKHIDPLEMVSVVSSEPTSPGQYEGEMVATVEA